MIDLNTKNTQGDIINVDYSGATAPTGAVNGIDMDLSNLAGAAFGIAAYHANLTDDGTTTTVGLDIDGSVEYGIDLDGITTTNTADIRLHQGALIENTDANTLTITEALVDFSGIVTADAYRVTNGTLITGAGGDNALTKANMQAASHWNITTAGGTANIQLGTDAVLDAADVGRTLTFGLGTGGNAVTFAAAPGGGATVTTINAGVGAIEDTGDWAACMVVSTTQITCATYGAD
jgi:hypothetical protein